MTLEKLSRPEAEVSPQTSPAGRDYRVLAGVILVADVLVLTVSVMVAWNLRHLIATWSLDPDPPHLVTVVWPVLIVSWLALIAVNGGYNLKTIGAGVEEFRAVALSSVVAAGALGLGCYLFKLPLSRGFVLLSLVVGTLLLVTERWSMRRVAHVARNRGRLTRRVIAVGGSGDIAEVLGALGRGKDSGYEVIGACAPAFSTEEPELFPVPVVGRPLEVRQLCREYGADTVLVARGGGYASSQELRRIAWDLEGTKIDLVVVPSLIEVAGPRIHMRPVAGLPLLHVEEPQAGAAGGLAKRLFDVGCAGLGLLCLSPLLLVVALVIKAQDGGPVFFRQSRVGREGRQFGMLKFRSMVVDAEARLADLLDKNESSGVLFKIKRDPRITRIGAFLRRYSIDELPQLINVVRGDMSLVGPRPPLPSEVDQYADEVHRRLLVRPGLTGLWQVSGRSELSWEESVRLDLYYVDNWSMTTDLIIIAKTVRAVVGSDGAY